MLRNCCFFISFFALLVGFFISFISDVRFFLHFTFGFGFYILVFYLGGCCVGRFLSSDKTPLIAELEFLIRNPNSKAESPKATSQQLFSKQTAD